MVLAVLLCHMCESCKSECLLVSPKLDTLRTTRAAAQRQVPVQSPASGQAPLAHSELGSPEESAWRESGFATGGFQKTNGTGSMPAVRVRFRVQTHPQLVSLFFLFSLLLPHYSPHSSSLFLLCSLLLCRHLLRPLFQKTKKTRCGVFFLLLRSLLLCSSCRRRTGIAFSLSYAISFWNPKRRRHQPHFSLSPSPSRKKTDLAGRFLDRILHRGQLALAIDPFA